MHPGGPTSPRLGVRPTTVRFQYSTQSENPWSDLDVDKRDGRSKEEWAVGMSGVDQLLEFVFELLSVGDLLLRVLFLEDTIEARYDVTVYLS